MIEFAPLCQVLNDHGVRYVVIGGVAANLHGSPILTNDVDICYARDEANLARMAAALQDLGATLRGAPEGLPFLVDEQTLGQGDRFTFDTRLGPLDIMGDPDGSGGYDALRANAGRFEIAGVEVWTCSLDDLIAMKRASGRVKDRIHVEEFVALREEREALAARGIDPDAPPSA